MGFSKDLLRGVAGSGSTGGDAADPPPGSPADYREKKLQAAEDADRRGPVQKQEVERRGNLSTAISEGVKGTEAVPKPYDPALLLDLAQNPVVQTYLDTMAQDAASANWKLERVDEEATVSDAEIAEAERRFRSLPASGTVMDLLETTSRGVLGTGDMPTVLNFAGGYNENSEQNELEEIVAFDPTTMFKTVDSDGFTDGYLQVTGSRRTQDTTAFDRGEVAWFSWGNRVGHVYGMSPVEKGQDTIEVIEEIAEKEILDLIQGTPPGIISRPDETDMPIDANDWANFRDDMALNEGERHRLGYAKFPVDYTPIAPNYQELQLLDRYKVKVTELGGVFKVNPSYAGFDFENQNRATDESQQLAYKQRGFQVLLRVLETGLTQNVIKPYLNDDLRLEFEKETTPEERQTVAETAKQTVIAGKEAADAGLDVSYRDGRLEIEDGEVEAGNVGGGGDGGGLFGSLNAGDRQAARKATGVVLGSPGGRAHTGDFQTWTKFLDRLADLGGEVVDLRTDARYPGDEISPEDALIEVRDLSEQEVLSTVHSFDDVTLRQVEDVDVDGTGEGNGNQRDGGTEPVEGNEDYPPLTKSEWKDVDAALYRAYENQIMPESAPGAEKEVWTSDEQLPDYVRDVLADVLDEGRAIFDSFESVPGRVQDKVAEIIGDNLLDDSGWSLGEIADDLQDSFDAISEGQAETVARTETSSVLNEAREEGYEDRPDAGGPQERFMWVGPDDSRTTDACERLKAETNPDYGGDPVTMPELKRAEERIHNEEFPDLEFRTHVVHINERHTFRRALPNEIDANQNISASVGSVSKELPEEVFEDISEERFVPPDGAAEAARQALEWIDEHGRDEAEGATEEGLARARQIIEHVEAGEPMTSENDDGTPFVVEIAGFVNRHRENRDIAEEFEGEPWKDNGYLSWLLWGGDAADTWANSLRDRLDEEGYL
jgi:hypothetical protein